MITTSTFGTLADGQTIEQYTLSNQQGVSVDILTLGGILKGWKLPVKQGPIDIVLGFDSLADYLNDQSYLGALVGRYANRIAQGKFTLDNQDYQVAVNQAGNCLHGGTTGFNHYVWQAEIISGQDNPALSLTMTSADGDQGFPGNISVKVIYTLTESNSLKIEYFAESDQKTVFNPTNHAYFNLAGHNSGSVREHVISVAASHFTPTDASAIPTGDITPVENSPFDLRQPTVIGAALASTHPQIQYGNGLDHNLCLDNFALKQSTAHYAATAQSAATGVEMKVYTSMPGIQVFTANHFHDMSGKEGAVYQANQGVCFESQFFPDSPNQNNFPSVELAAEQSFYSITEYSLSF